MVNTPLRKPTSIGCDKSSGSLHSQLCKVCSKTSASSTFASFASTATITLFTSTSIIVGAVHEYSLITDNLCIQVPEGRTHDAADQREPARFQAWRRGARPRSQQPTNGEAPARKTEGEQKLEEGKACWPARRRWHDNYPDVERFFFWCRCCLWCCPASLGDSVMSIRICRGGAVISIRSMWGYLGMYDAR